MSNSIFFPSNSPAIMVETSWTQGIRTRQAVYISHQVRQNQFEKKKNKQTNKPGCLEICPKYFTWEKVVDNSPNVHTPYFFPFRTH